jgi:hypothetical protein
MPFFVLEYEANQDDVHLIHREHSDCDRYPTLDNQLAIGFHDNGNEALKEARNYFDNVDGCSRCCKDCHRG